jgi:hypothetical protein
LSTNAFRACVGWLTVCVCACACVRGSRARERSARVKLAVFALRASSSSRSLLHGCCVCCMCVCVCVCVSRDCSEVGMSPSSVQTVALSSSCCLALPCLDATITGRDATGIAQRACTMAILRATQDAPLLPLSLCASGATQALGPSKWFATTALAPVISHPPTTPLLTTHRTTTPATRHHVFLIFSPRTGMGCLRSWG